MRFKVVIVIVILVALFSSPSFARVGWQPGPGKADPNWYGHYTHVTERNGKESALNFLTASVQELCDKLSKRDFAELYADLGVNIAKTGITRLGWKQGKGMYDTDWYGHYTHVLERSTNEGGRDKLISWFGTLHQQLDQEGFAAFYADAMTRMASYGISR